MSGLYSAFGFNAFKSVDVEYAVTSLRQDRSAALNLAFNMLSEYKLRGADHVDRLLYYSLIEDRSFEDIVVGANLEYIQAFENDNCYTLLQEYVMHARFATFGRDIWFYRPYLHLQADLVFELRHRCAEYFNPIIESEDLLYFDLFNDPDRGCEYKVVDSASCNAIAEAVARIWQNGRSLDEGIVRYFIDILRAANVGATIVVRYPL
ncbi:MAG: hypothetical protein JST22_07880 [Bacteroidetes bacterium]|nr:hypothetical protein [Bacteroidota bacterium]